MKSRSHTSVEHDGLGGHERRVFQIEANGKAFRTLIDGLYEDKIWAVVRELCSNAWDSHVEAGQDRPFQVDVPTLLDPTFRVRDFGVSLDHEDVMGLYSTIFRSTKEDTNSQVGKFGLGSKSPFAYGDTFVVNAYLDGFKRTYVANIMDEDLPEIRHLTTEPSDDSQGFEVSIPVSTGDFHEFQQAVVKMVLGADQRPEVNGLTHVIPEPVLSGDGWKIYSDDFDMGRFAIRQGCVLYPVRNQYPGIDEGYLLVADAPIGSCDVTANREALSMDPETREAVHQAAEAAWAGVESFMASLKYPNRLTEFQNRNRYSFIRSMHRSHALKLNPDKRNSKLPAQTLKVFDKGKVSKTSFLSSFSKPEGLTVLVDDGSKVLRKNLRITEYIRGRTARYGDSQVGVTTREDLPRLVRILGLNPEQIVSVSTLPDVPVVRNPTDGFTGGSTGTAAPKELPVGAWWVRKYGAISLGEGVSTRWNRSDLGTVGAVTSFWGQVAPLLTTLGFAEIQIVFLTEKQTDKFDPSGKQALVPEVQRRAAKYAAKYNFDTRFVGGVNAAVFAGEFPVGQYYSDKIKAVDRDAHSFIRDLVATEFGLGSKIDPTGIDNQIAELAGITFVPTLTKAMVSTKVDEYRKAYPLLFENGGMSLMEFYINETDSKEGHK